MCRVLNELSKINKAFVYFRVISWFQFLRAENRNHEAHEEKDNSIGLKIQSFLFFDFVSCNSWIEKDLSTKNTKEEKNERIKTNCLLPS